MYSQNEPPYHLLINENKSVIKAFLLLYGVLEYQQSSLVHRKSLN